MYTPPLLVDSIHKKIEHTLKDKYNPLEILEPSSATGRLLFNFKR